MLTDEQAAQEREETRKTFAEVKQHLREAHDVLIAVTHLVHQLQEKLEKSNGRR